jgi:hypothetical protein
VLYTVSVLFTTDNHTILSWLFVYFVYVSFGILSNYLFLKRNRIWLNWWFCLITPGESCSVEKELESTIATNAVYQDKTNIIFSVFFYLCCSFHQIHIQDVTIVSFVITLSCKLGMLHMTSTTALVSLVITVSCKLFILYKTSTTALVLIKWTELAPCYTKYWLCNLEEILYIRNILFLFFNEP